MPLGVARAEPGHERALVAGARAACPGAARPDPRHVDRLVARGEGVDRARRASGPRRRRAPRSRPTALAWCSSMCWAVAANPAAGEPVGEEAGQRGLAAGRAGDRGDARAAARSRSSVIARAPADHASAARHGDALTRRRRFDQRDRPSRSATPASPRRRAGARARSRAPRPSSARSAAPGRRCRRRARCRRWSRTRSARSLPRLQIGQERSSNSSKIARPGRGDDLPAALVVALPLAAAVQPRLDEELLVGVLRGRASRAGHGSWCDSPPEAITTTRRSPGIAATASAMLRPSCTHRSTRGSGAANTLTTSGTTGTSRSRSRYWIAWVWPWSICSRAEIATSVPRSTSCAGQRLREGRVGPLRAPSASPPRPAPMTSPTPERERRDQVQPEPAEVVGARP